ncbi:septum formation family protein [Mycobacterium sp. E740]|uniref:septum formation family protein n=1 Tax=Mycobacterium sp. E740 TaxID=1834149 RepID=UPI001E4BC428|nr:septum formation family protein [Mycobacterium sp. E740]
MHDAQSPTSSSTKPSTPSAATTPPPPPKAAVAAPENWFDLEVGDCLTAVPQIDLGEVTAPVVDCAEAHRAEVYRRAPLEVNAATADVADKTCADAIGPYTGGGRYAVTYLIDSNQDRTADNPLPSTVICLLQSADGSALTGSARR